MKLVGTAAPDRLELVAGQPSGILPRRSDAFIRQAHARKGKRSFLGSQTFCNVLVGDTVALDFGQCLGLSGFAGFHFCEHLAAAGANVVFGRLLFGVVGGADHGAGLADAEADFEGVFLPACKFLGGDPAVDVGVLLGGL